MNCLQRKLYIKNSSARHPWRVNCYLYCFYNAHRLHILRAVAFFCNFPRISGQPVPVMRVVEIIILFIISHQQHAVFIGYPGKDPVRSPACCSLKKVPLRTGDRFTHINACPADHRHSVIDILYQKFLQRRAGLINRPVCRCLMLCTALS